MNNIGFVCSGDGSHLASFEDYAGYIDRMIYIQELDQFDLHDFRALVVPDFSDREALDRHSAQLNDYLAKGGFLSVFEPNRADMWISVAELEWFDRKAKDWLYWTKPGGRLEVYYPTPQHSLARAMPVEDMSWHFFGAYRLPPGATPILNLDEDEGCLMFDLPLDGGGRLLVSTIDPHAHNGHRFMPATTRFLNRFYPWLLSEVSVG